MDILSYTLGKKAGGGSSPAVLQDKEVEITENGETTVRADSGYDGLSSVEITVSGILDTSDADAVASDMAMGKTAYVDGNKITGNVHIGSPSVSTNYSATDVDIYIDDLQVDTQQGNTNQMFRTGDKISVYTPLSDVAPVVGASAEKIKKDEVICGVTGTYEGGSGKYAPKWIKFGSQYNSDSFRGNDLSYEVANLDTSNITDMRYMFGSCDGLTSLDLRGFNTSNATDMYGMFYGCSNLTSLNLSGWDVSKVTYIRNMFNGCQKLTSINVPDFDISKINASNGMSGMFSGMNLLASLDLSNFYVNRNINISYMFSYGKALMFIDMRNFDFTKITNTSYYSYMFGSSANDGPPDNCEIIVADATQKQWINTNFNRMTNVKTVAEYEAE